MEAATTSASALRAQIVATEQELSKLKEQLAKIEEKETSVNEIPVEPVTSKWPLSQEEYTRYGRQMIVPSIGIQGQLRLKNAKVLIIGAGGLGCPAAAYLAGAGVGTLGIVDGDTVELSNLHRQILHTTARVGMKKVDSAISYLSSLNPNPTYTPHPTHLTPSNAPSILAPYDVVLDCTDNPASRYLISDTCVLLRKPLVSASALRTEGQLIVLNHPALPAGNELGGPCYRCVFPKPPPVESVVSCGDGGVLGPVVGVMGVLQAAEAVRLICGGGLGGSGVEGRKEGNRLLIFGQNGEPQFRSLKMRGRRKGCFACSGEGGLGLESLSSGSLDYVLFCGLSAPVNILHDDERILPRDYDEVKKKGGEHLLVDVREKVQFDICSIEGSINVPFSRIQRGEGLGDGLGEDERPVYVVCRLGNDSQVVVRKLKDAGLERVVGDIRGGLRAWRKEVDASWPEY
ncbi:Adenylyltransferase and sulfurtransferase [Lachnellula hyalina]|uniref:Adenylyltransferase and sulfurtransferase uba4 n=1 Tax=Lachnellula hyalina TaxID=1316788 RepID=A0A8H8TTU5_9HELO|nr:Adenylyltransferase and sulfurtransferase [Lachnellula hyalina]TVY22149.1 Adenylyltransferase and sulfurtransferase [Lachnellula hyalina]